MAFYRGSLRSGNKMRRRKTRSVYSQVRTDYRETETIS